MLTATVVLLLVTAVGCVASWRGSLSWSIPAGFGMAASVTAVAASWQYFPQLVCLLWTVALAASLVAALLRQDKPFQAFYVTWGLLTAVIVAAVVVYHVAYIIG